MKTSRRVGAVRSPLFRRLNGLRVIHSNLLDHVCVPHPLQTSIAKDEESFQPTPDPVRHSVLGFDGLSRHHYTSSLMPAWHASNATRSRLGTLKTLPLRSILHLEGSFKLELGKLAFLTFLFAPTFHPSLDSSFAINSLVNGLEDIASSGARASSHIDGQDRFWQCCES